MKSFINKILDVPKLILRLWIILWICLAILLIMKFCFGIWYPIVSNNELFNKMCDFIDNNEIFYKIIALTLYVFSFNILFLSYTGKKKYDNWIWALIINTLGLVVGAIKILNNIIGFVLEIACILTYIIINLKCKNFDRTWKNILVPIIIYVTINLWQFNILIVRNTSSLVLNELSMLIGLIIMLDYYIFIIILWIGVSYMGWFSMGWFFGKDITELKAHKEKELAKKNPDMELVAKIDAKIAELEKEGK